MPLPAAREKRDAAIAVSERLSLVPGVSGVCIFGSVARGDARAESDVDVLVVTDGRSMRSSELRERLAGPTIDQSLSISCHTPEGLRRYLARWSRFSAHLRREGWVTFDRDGQLSRILAHEVPVSTEQEKEVQRRRLHVFDHPERFGGRFLFPLARIYRIGRVAVYTRLADAGVLEFDRDSAFERLAELEPSRADDIQAIRRLAPFYETVRRGDSTIELPFDPVGVAAEEIFVEARSVVTRLLGEKRGTT